MTEKKDVVKVGEEIHKINTLFAKLCSEHRRNSVQRAVVLKKIYDERIWEKSGCVSFDQYLAQPEYNMSRGDAVKAIKTLNAYLDAGCKVAQIEDISMNSLYLCKDTKHPEKWLDAMRNNSIADVKAQVLKREYGVEEDEHEKKKHTACPYWDYVEDICRRPPEMVQTDAVLEEDNHDKDPVKGKEKPASRGKGDDFI